MDLPANPRFCRAAREGRLLIVTIDRPGVMNALHTEAHAELAAVFDAYAGDADLWCAILTGSGERAFSTGDDMKSRAAGRPTVLPPSGFCGLSTRFDLTKPVIAAVNGLALGGGFEAVLACDIVVAEEHAEFALPEPLVGTVATSGGIARLVRQIPPKAAMGMILTGRRVGAAEGLAMGFVTEVVPRSGALASARAWGERVLACAPMAIRASKAIALEALAGAVPLHRQLADLPPEVAQLRAGEDYLEGARAFAEKRPPRWSGR